MLPLLLLFFLPHFARSSVNDKNGIKFSSRVAGDVVLGGLFPMHEYNVSRRDMPCGAIKEEKGIQVRKD